MGRNVDFARRRCGDERKMQRGRWLGCENLFTEEHFLLEHAAQHLQLALALDPDAETVRCRFALCMRLWQVIDTLPSAGRAARKRASRVCVSNRRTSSTRRCARPVSAFTDSCSWRGTWRPILRRGQTATLALRVRSAAAACSRPCSTCPRTRPPSTAPARALYAAASIATFTAAAARLTSTSARRTDASRGARAVRPH